ncbi:excalibur calcium-binding domain-containing protein, partial [Kibdelosporangium lantanae]
EPPAPRHRTETHLTLTFDLSDLHGLDDLDNLIDDCDVARAFGLAPMRKGDPGYRANLDKDHDGIACEY